MLLEEVAKHRFQAGLVRRERKDLDACAVGIGNGLRASSGRHGRLPSWLASRNDRVEGEPYAGEYPQPRPQEAGRVLVPPIEQIVDSRIGGDAVAEIVGAGEVHQTI